MTPFKDQPIARKALVLGIVPAVAGLLLVAATVTAVTYDRARKNTLADLAKEVKRVSQIVTVSLGLQDRSLGPDLESYTLPSNVDAVCVFDRSGAPFLQTPPNTTCASHFVATSARADLEHAEPVFYENQLVGWVLATGNLTRLGGWLRSQIVPLAATIAAALLLALILTRRLQRSIVLPIEHLAATADLVSASGNYRLRAQRLTGDEVGRLVHSFNSMLDEIQRHSEKSATLLEREQTTNRLKDEFLAAVSHELRTPLNAVLGWLQILQTTNPNPEALHRALVTIDRNARAQARVVEDLIDVSRIVTGKMQIRSDVVDLARVIDGAVDIMRPAITAKSLRLSTSVQAGACLVSGDANRLQQIVLNLLSNAVKFTAAGGAISLGLAVEGREFAIRVSDSGIGISPEFLPYVFDRFRQGDGSMTREHGGLGLGLAIAKELTELHGGSLTVGSHGTGYGTTFTLRLPVLTGHGAASAVPAVAVNGTSRLDGARILAVDDDRDGLEVVAEALRAVGADVRAVASGAEAVELSRQEPFDVLLCDLAMPHVDGYEVLRTLRESSPTRHTPVAIAITAHASEEMRRSTSEAGFVAHVAKPVELHALVEVVARARRAREHH